MIYLAADHRGFGLKETIKKMLAEQGIANEDCGAFAYEQGDDYVDFAAAASANIATNPAGHKGIFICGSGQGMDIVANKFKGIRAALCWNRREAEQSRRDDDANVLVLAADQLTPEEAKEIMDVWLATPFGGEERHVRRLKKIEKTEERNFK